MHIYVCVFLFIKYIGFIRGAKLYDGKERKSYETR